MSAGGPIAFAIILMGVIIGVALAQPSLEDAMDDLKSAKEEASDSIVGTKNTDFSVDSVSINNTTSVLNVSISNRGSDPIPSRGFLLLVNGENTDYLTGSDKMVYPSGTTVLSAENVSGPEVVRVVGPWGIARTTDHVEVE